MNRIVINIVLLSLIVLFTSSCKKKSAASLQGDWELIYLQETTPAGEKEIWNFDGTTKLEKKIIKLDTTIVITGTYYYYSKSMAKDKISIAGLGNIDDGIYIVQKFKNGTLQIQREELSDGSAEGAFRWKDFSKKE